MDFSKIKLGGGPAGSPLDGKKPETVESDEDSLAGAEGLESTENSAGGAVASGLNFGNFSLSKNSFGPNVDSIDDSDYYDYDSVDDYEGGSIQARDLYADDDDETLDDDETVFEGISANTVETVTPNLKTESKKETVENPVEKVVEVEAQPSETNPKPIVKSPAKPSAGLPKFPKTFEKSDGSPSQIEGLPAVKSGGNSVAQELKRGTVEGHSADTFDEFFEDFVNDDDDYEGSLGGVETRGEVIVKELNPRARIPEHEFENVNKGVDERKETAARRREERTKNRLKKYSGKTSYKRNRRGLDSSIAVTGPGEYLVDDSGELISKSKSRVESSSEFDKLVKAAGKNRELKVNDAFVARVASESSRVIGDSSVQDVVIYPWMSDAEKERAIAGDNRVKQRVNQKELDFFRGLSDSKNSILADEELVEELRLLGAPPPRGKAKRQLSASRNAVAGGSRGFARSVDSALKLPDLEYLRFLAKFKYATAKHLGRVNGVQERSASNRLKRLASKGLVESMPLWGNDDIWVLTDAGMLLSGFELPVIKPSTLKYMLIPHQFTVNNTAANLWGGNVNVLNLSDFPGKNRVNSLGESVFGEEVVSETEINSSFARMKKLTSADVYRPLVMGAIDRSFENWRQAGGARAGIPSPEFTPGNEYMWILYPPAVMRRAHHIPDLVVPRQRGIDGMPESIAVEIELMNKLRDRYVATLQAYKYDQTIYKKVIWVCRSLGTAKTLESVAKEIGLWQEGRIDIVPILTEDGVFKGRDLWRI